MELYALKINGLVNPVGYLLDHVSLSWKVRNARGRVQKTAAVRVEADGKAVFETSGNLDSLGTALSFPLLPHTRYVVMLTVESDAGETAAGNCYFETGKLDEPWTAKWIGTDGDGSYHPEYRKRFALARPVRAARLSICGLGVFEAHLNSETVGTDLLAPFINDYQEHFQICTYDVIGLLRKENELTVLLGNGWYRGRFGLGGTAHYDRPFALITELRLVYDDGSVETIGTDESWQLRRSFTVASDIYDGETQDYTAERGAWEDARIIPAPGKLVDRYSPSLTAHEAFPVKELIRTPAGETVLDFGQNMAGYVVVSTDHSFTLEFGEILQNGNFYHENYRTAKSVFRYISDGGTRAVRPLFTFFGFRYVKVSEMESVDPAAFTAYAVYSDMERTGFLETGNEKINRLHENTLWGLKSNFLDMPTDCPQRDERLGWCGDAQVFAPTASYLMDTRTFYGKFLRDLRSDQQRHGGSVAMYLPNEFAPMCAAVWSDIATLLPETLYRSFGDKEALRRAYSLMRDWVEYVRSMDRARGEKHLWDFGFQYGDWLALDGSTEQSTFGRTDSGYIASLYCYNSARIVAEAAKLFGYEEASEYEALAGEIRAAILREYFTATGRLAIDTQTGYLCALRFGIYSDKQRILDGLKNRIKKDLNRIKGGFVGATMMNTVLADHGLADTAYDFLFYEGFPGWLYAVNLGATTIWERWNSVLPDGTISGTGMNSLNHYAYGSVIEFLYRHAAGIQALEPGYRKIRVAPKPEIRLGSLRCRYDSAGGLVVSEWKIRPDGGVDFHMEIPFGCTAEIALPEQKPFTVSAGTYDYSIRTQRDYCALYDENTPMERLLQDEHAVTLLGPLAKVDRSDPEAMSKSLADARKRAVLFRAPTDGIDKIIEEIKKLRG